MEILTDIVNNQLNLYIPVALVIVGAILVFTFGFKSAEQPPFDKLSILDDRKAGNKKRKIKEKKPSVNGHVVSGESKNDKSPSKENKRSPAKESELQKNKKPAESLNKQAERTKKVEPPKSKTLEEIKNKKNLKKANNEKPSDFDEGHWETVPSKADKKKKQEQSPAKKDKKDKKKNDKPVELDKLTKEAVNKELQKQEEEKEKEVEVEKIEISIEPSKIQTVIEEVIIPEEKKDKKKEKKIKKDTEKIEKQTGEPKEEQIIENKIVEATEKITLIKAEAEVEAVKAAPAVSVKEGGVVFDELGDIWTDAKQPKKSKKKARRDN